MKVETGTLLVVLLLLVSAGTGYFVGFTNQKKMITSDSTTTPSTLSTSYGSNNTVFVMNVNGSYYYADDISRDIVVMNPGYSYFLNGSVLFDGVEFETICSPTYSGCPTQTNTTKSTTVLAGAFRFSMAFPDGSDETVGSIIGDLTYVFALSQHTSPRAGILVEYVQYDYPYNFPPYHVFLLVSNPSCCG